MDIKREPPKKTKQIVGVSIGLIAVVVVTVALGRLSPAAPPVERGTLWIDTVKRGPMTRDVNAPGSLEPENPLNITALTAGRVEALPLTPGVPVTPSTVIVVLDNPDERTILLQDQQSLTGAQAALASLQTSLKQGLISEQSSIASLQTQYNAAIRQAAVDDSLAKKNLASTNDVAGARDAANEMKTRVELEQRRLQEMQASQDAQLKLSQDQINGLQAIVANQQRRLESMRVTSPISGQLQALGNPPLELGQYVTAGMQIARVVQPGKLKAVLRVPENLAKDVVPGQPAVIDLHNNNTVKGHVTRTDPSSVQGTVTVDVAIDDTLPTGTRSDLAVDGTIQLQRLANVLYMGRPGFGQPDASVGIFKVSPNKGEATRVTVQLGVASVNTIEIKGGLAVGDSVIISDMSAFDNTNRVRIK